MRRILWPHQAAAVRACLDVLGKHPGYVQMPTGSGKGDVIRQVALAWLAESPQHRAVIGVPNHTIALQLRRAFLCFGPEIPSLYFEGFRLSRASRLVIATYASLIGSERLFDRRHTLFLSDECHHVNAHAPAYAAVAWHFGKRLGFSASPWSEGCRETFGGRLLYGMTLTEGQRAGALCDFRVARVEQLAPPLDLRWQLYFVRDGTRFDAVDANRSVFFDDYQNARRSLDNERIVRMFQDGSLRIIYANRMLLEGFDCVQIKNIYIEKHTSSEILMIQIVGRGLRKLKDENCTVQIDNDTAIETLERAVDYANNPI